MVTLIYRGFQFWRQGYWADHLRGRPYHISALYVVDLQVFRSDTLLLLLLLLVTQSVLNVFPPFC
jgi:hypothetical protein